MAVKEKKKNNIIIVLVIIIVLLVVIFVIPSKEGQIKNNFKTSFKKVVEKSDLETASITYNIIAKKCKNEEKCNKKSNNIEDFEYVVSCEGTIVAGIDFKKIDVDFDKKTNKLIVSLPEATIKDEPIIGKVRFLNGDEVSGKEYPNARKLCQEATKEKSNNDERLLKAAKEQARVVLEEYYNQWIKAYDSSYDVVIK